MKTQKKKEIFLQWKCNQLLNNPILELFLMAKPKKYLCVWELVDLVRKTKRKLASMD